MRSFDDMLTGNGRVADRTLVVFDDDPPLTLVDIIGERPAWHLDAACREHPAMTWYPESGRTPPALLDVCGGCLVRAECLTAGFAEEFGVWGGLTVVGRRRVLAGASAA